YMEKEEEAAGYELKRWIDRVKLCGFNATGRIAVGRLIETFSRTMHDFKVPALVLSHKSHIMRTSISERLIKSLDVPMLVVRGKKADNAVLGSVAIRNVLCAVDFSGHSLKALEFARTLSEKNSAALVVTHVLSSLEPDDEQKYLNHAIQEAEQSMRSTANIPDKAELLVVTGVPYKAINDIASRRNMDLIVI